MMISDMIIVIFMVVGEVGIVVIWVSGLDVVLEMEKIFCSKIFLI